MTVLRLTPVALLLLSLLSLICPTSSILLELSAHNSRRCYMAELSPDKVPPSLARPSRPSSASCEQTSTSAGCG